MAEDMAVRAGALILALLMLAGGVAGILVAIFASPIAGVIIILLSAGLAFIAIIGLMVWAMMKKKRK